MFDRFKMALWRRHHYVFLGFGTVAAGYGSILGCLSLPVPEQVQHFLIGMVVIAELGKVLASDAVFTRTHTIMVRFWSLVFYITFVAFSGALLYQHISHSATVTEDAKRQVEQAARDAAEKAAAEARAIQLQIDQELQSQRDAQAALLKQLEAASAIADRQSRSVAEVRVAQTTIRSLAPRCPSKDINCSILTDLAAELVRAEEVAAARVTVSRLKGNLEQLGTRNMFQGVPGAFQTVPVHVPDRSRPFQTVPSPVPSPSTDLLEAAVKHGWQFGLAVLAELLILFGVLVKAQIASAIRVENDEREKAAIASSTAVPKAPRPPKRGATTWNTSWNTSWNTLEHEVERGTPKSAGTSSVEHVPNRVPAHVPRAGTPTKSWIVNQIVSNSGLSGSNRELAEKARISHTTMGRALRELLADGKVIWADRGAGPVLLLCPEATPAVPTAAPTTKPPTLTLVRPT